MTRQEYLNKRNALLAEAEAAINDGKLDVYEAKEAEIKALDAEYEKAAVAAANARAAKERLADLSGSAVGQKEVVDQMGGTADEAGVRNVPVQASAERGRDLRKGETVKVASFGFIVGDPYGRANLSLTSDGVVTPRRYSPDITPTFNEVSSLIDRVTIISRLNGESYTRPYVAGYDEAAETTDDADYEDVETEFGAVAINKVKVTAYSEEDEGVLKLPDADYDAEVQRGIRIALRKRITKQIMVGPGTTNRICGIFTSTYDAANKTFGTIDPNTDIAISEINEDTLDEIIFSYGGEEDVEDPAVLILSKYDLKVFAQLRSAGGNRIHTIRTNGNVGTIDGIPFIINSACGAISLPTTAVDEYCMAYGNLSNYGLVIFSDIDIARSTDYKFKQGKVAHRGSIYVGGNVIRKNGFVRVKKG